MHCIVSSGDLEKPRRLVPGMKSLLGGAALKLTP
jgi:hypothetical protein